jgi:hypothetical protein
MITPVGVPTTFTNIDGGMFAADRAPNPLTYSAIGFRVDFATPITVSTSLKLSGASRSSSPAIRTWSYSVNGGGATNVLGAWGSIFPAPAETTGFTGSLSSIEFLNVSGPGMTVWYIEVDGVIVVDSGLTLTLTNSTDLANMQVGDSVVEVGGGADGTGTITAIDPAGPTLSLNPVTGTWTVGATAKDTSRTTVPPAPTTLPPDPLKYTAITGSPLSVTAAPFTTVTLPQANLATGRTYYARVQYATTNAAAATSSFSGWSSFAT